MKVLLINGSPHEHGCTYTALAEISKTLLQHQIETEIFHIGRQSDGCIGCNACAKGTHRCIFGGTVNEALDKMEGADALVLGSPVYFASPNGTFLSFLDRMFYAGNCLAYKPGAAIVSARRGGTTASVDALNKYFAIRNMPMVSSQYWNMVHGNTPEEVMQDLEGLQIMRTLGNNMAWLLKSIEAGKKAGISLPKKEELVKTNFIR